MGSLLSGEFAIVSEQQGNNGTESDGASTTGDPAVALTTLAVNLDAALAALKRDLTKLEANLGTIEHTVKTECAGLTLRLHFPAFRQRKPMVAELIDAVSLHIINFCLPRSQVNEVQALYNKIPVDEFMQRVERMRQEAFDLFKRAHQKTNRNGEAGELILYLLTEWLLGAPQIIAKMSLKTSSEMAVHGADGVHVRYCTDTGRLFVYWGEAKLYQDIGSAITAAAESIAESLREEKVKHEITLVKRFLNLSDLEAPVRSALLELLDPFGSETTNRHDVVTCLIAFDFDGFVKAEGATGDAQAEFRKLALVKLDEAAPKIANALKDKGMAHQAVEMFIVPVPSIARMRELFQDKIGWKHPVPEDEETAKKSGKRPK